jgi:hypothetical protein
MIVLEDSNPFYYFLKVMRKEGYAPSEVLPVAGRALGCTIDIQVKTWLGEKTKDVAHVLYCNGAELTVIVKDTKHHDPIKKILSKEEVTLKKMGLKEIRLSGGI